MYRISDVRDSVNFPPLVTFNLFGMIFRSYNQDFYHAFLILNLRKRAKNNYLAGLYSRNGSNAETTRILVEAVRKPLKEKEERIDYIDLTKIALENELI